MAFISDDQISQIRQAADLVDIVSETVHLKKNGRNYTGLCPFHSEKTPSFSVSREKQLYYCFGCGEGGDVFSFIMKRDGISFPDALRHLAGRYGIPLDTGEMSPEARARIRLREGIYRVNQLALDFFQEQLRMAPHVRRYLVERNIADETGQAFEIGFAPDGWHQLSDYLYRKQVPKDLAIKSGLLMENDRGGVYDRFRNRVIFPIRNTSSQIAGFGGRVLDDSRPKYLNSPETPVYHKGRMLYGMPVARAAIRDSGIVYVVEGYVDVIALHQAVVRNVVATLGTALTGEHVRLLKGHASEGVLVFDSDAAGIKAAERSIPIFETEMMDVRILVLPDGEDPDAFVSVNGGEAFCSLAGNATSVIRFLTDISVQRHGLSVEGQLHVLDDLQGPIRAVQDGLKRSLYIRDLSERIGVPENDIRERYRSADIPRQQKRENVPNTGMRGFDWRGKDKLEKRILAMMVQFPEIHTEVLNRNVLSLFRDPELRKLGEVILGGYRKSGDGTFHMPIEGMDPVMASAIAALSVSDDEWVYAGCVKLLDQFAVVRKGRQKAGRAIHSGVQAASSGTAFH